MMDKNQDRLLEQSLEAALFRYGNIDPPPGLEGRIEAKLSERRSAQKSWWIWSPALALVSTLLIAAVVIHLNGIDRPRLLQPIAGKTAPDVPQLPQPIQPVEFGVDAALAQLGSTPAVATQVGLVLIEEQASLEVVSGIALLELSSGVEEDGISELQIEDLAISDLEIPSLADSPEEPTEEEKT